MTTRRAGRVDLAEVLALRTLFLNLEFRGGRPGSDDRGGDAGLIERADGVKESGRGSA